MSRINIVKYMLRVIGDVTHWQCEKRDSCKARIHTKGSVIIKRTNEHLHDAEMTHIRNLEVKVGIKRRARESNDPVHHIVGDELQDAATETVVKLPKIDSLKRTIRRRVHVTNCPCNELSM